MKTDGNAILTDVRRLLNIERMPVVLDTNILINAFEAKTQQHREWIVEFCKKQDIHICDTVYYEFLRNVNIRRFRERRAKIASWAMADFLDDDSILREDAAVGGMYEKLWLLYLNVMNVEPKRMMHIPTEDLWIAAVTVLHRIDHILTTDDSGDFPPEIWLDERFDFGANLHLHLKTFRREDARRYWMEMRRRSQIEIDLRSVL